MLGRGVASILAVHTPKALKLFAATYVTEPVVGYTLGCEFSERGETRQGRQRRVVDVLAVHREAAKRCSFITSQIVSQSFAFIGPRTEIVFFF